MKTVVQKSDGKFDTLNILLNELTEVDWIEKIIRAAEDNDNTLFTDYEKDKSKTLLKICEEITRKDHKELF